MTATVELAVATAATADEVHAAFAQRQYWLDRFTAFGGHTELSALTVDADGAVDVAATVHLSRAMLPGPVRRIVPGELSMAHRERWHRAGDGQVRGQITISVPGAAGGGRGQAWLEPADGAGSVLRFTATVQVALPLVGGQVERVIGGQLRRNIPAIQNFTGEWIEARRGS